MRTAFETPRENRVEALRKTAALRLRRVYDASRCGFCGTDAFSRGLFCRACGAQSPGAGSPRWAAMLSAVFSLAGGTSLVLSAALPSWTAAFAAAAGAAVLSAGLATAAMSVRLHSRRASNPHEKAALRALESISASGEGRKITSVSPLSPDPFGAARAG